MKNTEQGSDKSHCNKIFSINNKVYEGLIDKFQNCELHVMYMLSHNYYGSTASLNEMRAAWAMKQNWSAILLPGFDFGEIAGCIDPSQIGIKLDDSDTATLKYRLGELKEILTKEFGLRSMSSAIWERRRDACVMLAYASEDSNGQIMQLVFLGGTSISTKGIEFVRKNTPRELARWTSAIDELLRQGDSHSNYSVCAGEIENCDQTSDKKEVEYGVK